MAASTGNRPRRQWIAAAGLIAQASTGSASGTRVEFDLKAARPALAGECFTCLPEEN
jgi:hypothetical protein